MTGDGMDDVEVWVPPAHDCMERRSDYPCPHCPGVDYHHRTGRCGACGRRRPAPPPLYRTATGFTTVPPVIS